MTKKLILVLMLASVCTTSGCSYFDWLNSFAGGGCGISYCCTYGPANTPYHVIYPDGSRRNNRSIGINGVGTFDMKSPLGNRYSCSSIVVAQGSFFGFTLTAAPSSIDLNAAPSSVTISGQAFDGTYGMPMVEYFDTSGYLIGSATATAVAGDGSWVVATAPDLSVAYSGTFQIQVTNMRSDGEYLDIVGTATMSCYGRDRPDSDGDGYYDDEDCYPYDPTLWCGGGGGDGGGGGGGECFGHECEMY